MTTTTPYSDEWREHTRARMLALALNTAELAQGTGLPHSKVFAALMLDGVDVGRETTGPIDELLDKLEAASDAYAVEHGTRKLEALHAGEAVRVERIAVPLDRLINGRPTPKPGDAP